MLKLHCKSHPGPHVRKGASEPSCRTPFPLHATAANPACSSPLPCRFWPRWPSNGLPCLASIASPYPCWASVGRSRPWFGYCAPPPPPPRPPAACSAFSSASAQPTPAAPSSTPPFCPWPRSFCSPSSPLAPAAAAPGPCPKTTTNSAAAATPLRFSPTSASPPSSQPASSRHSSIASAPTQPASAPPPGPATSCSSPPSPKPPPIPFPLSSAAVSAEPPSSSQTSAPSPPALTEPSRSSAPSPAFSAPPSSPSPAPPSSCSTRARPASSSSPPPPAFSSILFSAPPSSDAACSATTSSFPLHPLRRRRSRAPLPHPLIVRFPIQPTMQPLPFQSQPHPRVAHNFMKIPHPQVPIRNMPHRPPRRRIHIQPCRVRTAPVSETECVPSLTTTTWLPSMFSRAICRQPHRLLARVDRPCVSAIIALSAAPRSSQQVVPSPPHPPSCLNPYPPPPPQRHNPPAQSCRFIQRNRPVQPRVIHRRRPPVILRRPKHRNRIRRLRLVLARHPVNRMHDPRTPHRKSQATPLQAPANPHANPVALPACLQPAKLYPCWSALPSRSLPRLHVDAHAALAAQTRAKPCFTASCPALTLQTQRNLMRRNRALRAICSTSCPHGSNPQSSSPWLRAVGPPSTIMRQHPPQLLPNAPRIRALRQPPQICTRRRDRHVPAASPPPARFRSFRNPQRHIPRHSP